MHTQIKQWSEQIREASAHGKALRIRGGGSKDFYGQALQGMTLSSAAYQGVISYEPSELVITVRAGTPLAEIEQLLAQNGQCFAFEPPHFDAPATIGGMVAAGLAGPARAAVGGVRDYVLGVRFLNGQGQDLTFGGQVMKNVAGYDVSRLMAGSMGQLGLLTELSLKVLPTAPAQASFALGGLSQDKALQLLHTWGGQPLPLNASVWHDNTLTVRLMGAVAAVQSALGQMKTQAQQQGAQVLQADTPPTFWQELTQQRHAFFQSAAPDHALWRLSVPQVTPDLTTYGLQGSVLVEWQGGQRWLWAPAQDAERIRAVMAQVEGHATLFRPSRAGGESDRQVGVFTPLSSVQQRIQQSLKQQFDPAGVFNPGRL
jgi:glycolate oxidase FAD binding subunit